MRFRIAHLMWLIAACAVYFGAIRLCRQWGGDWVESLIHPLMWGLALFYYGSIFFHWLPKAFRDDNRQASEEFVKQYTSGRNVLISDE